MLTFSQQQISVTVRPQVAANQRSAAPSSQADKIEQARMRSSVALQPTDEIIQPKQASRCVLYFFFIIYQILDTRCLYARYQQATM